MPEKKKSNMMRYVGLGAELMGTLGAATWLGWFIDGKTAWEFPLFIIILPLIALVYSLWKLIKAFDNTQK